MEFYEERDQTAIAFGNALIELLAEKGLSDITVTELAKQAGFSRKTFYARYRNVADVMEELLHHMQQNTGSMAELPGFATDPSVIPNYLREALGQSGSGNQSIILMKRDLLVFNFYNRMLSESFLEVWEKLYPLKHDRLRLYADATVAGICDICKNWAQMHRPLPIDEFCDFLEFYLTGLFGALQATAEEPEGRKPAAARGRTTAR